MVNSLKAKSELIHVTTLSLHNDVQQTHDKLHRGKYVFKMLIRLI